MREERREEREERREKSAERSEKREEITKKAARDPQMRLFEQQQLTDRTGFALDPGRIYTGSRGHLEKVTVPPQGGGTTARIAAF